MSALADNIRELLAREPFRPFRLVTTSGKHYDVVDPQSTVLLKSEIFIAFPDGEHWALVPLLHVGSIEERANGRRGGRKRKKR